MSVFPSLEKPCFHKGEKLLSFRGYNWVEERVGAPTLRRTVSPSTLNFILSNLNESAIDWFNTYPRPVPRKNILFQQNKAKIHTAKKTRNKIEEFDGVVVLLHPDVAISDYGLF